MNEKELEKKLNAKIKSLGGLSIKLLSYLFAGLPDRMCLLPGGRIIFVELKTTGKLPTKIQLIVHRKLRELGFAVLVIDTLKQINAIKECLASAKGLSQLELAKVIETCKAYQASFTSETSEDLKQYVTALIAGYRKLLKK